MRTRVSSNKLAANLRERIEAGGLRAGDKLPSFEQLRRQLGASCNVVARAYDTLERDGLVDRRERSGIYVSQTVPRNKRVRIAVHCLDLSTIVRSDYWSNFSSGVQHTAYACGAQVTFIPVGDQDHIDDCSGLLAFGISNKRALDLREKGLSVVGVSNPLPGTPCISSDDFEAGFLATHHLVELGHRRIAFWGALTTKPVLYRLSGYYGALGDIQSLLLAQLAEYQKTFEGAFPGWDDRLVRGLLYSEKKPYGTMKELAYFNMERWLLDGFDGLGCTAIIVQNDFYAIGVMQCLIDHGYRIPEDISVVGFDNERECLEVNPRLTSVGADMFELGSRAVGMLMRAIDGEKVEDSLVPVSLTARDSTGPPRQ